MESYKSIEIIGQGTYGVVYKAMHLKTGKLVAMKKIRVEHEDEGIPMTAIREVAALQELTHKNIVRLLEVVVDKLQLYLIFEYLNMDLDRYINTFEEGKMIPKHTVASYLHQINEGILYCHNRMIMHRDLKPQNLLIDGKGGIKIGDFGLGRTLGLPARVYSHEVVTLWYRAPEILLGAKRYSLPVDIWSIGCIFAEMVTKEPLFNGDSQIDQLYRIFQILKTPTEEIWPGVTSLSDYKTTFPQWKIDKLSSVVPTLDTEGMNLLRSMLTYNPKTRITARVISHHPYFDQFNFGSDS